MPLTALALILVAALLHAGWNIVAKRADGGPHFALWSALAVSLLWAPLGLWLTWQHAPGFGWRAAKLPRSAVACWPACAGGDAAGAVRRCEAQCRARQSGR